MKIFLNFGQNVFNIEAIPDEDGILYRLSPEGISLARGIIADANPVPEVYTTFETEYEKEDMLEKVPDRVLMALLGIKDRHQLKGLQIEVGEKKEE